MPEQFDFSTLITDRSSADVSSLSALLKKPLDTWTAEEMEAFNSGGLKGGYWWTDLNRVDACMAYLDVELANLGYSSGYVSPGKVWMEEDNPTISDMEKYIENVKSIRKVFENVPGNPDAPDSVKYLTYQKANDIERILQFVETTIQQIARAFCRSNAFTFWSGYRPLPSAESNKGRTWEELDAMNTGWRNWQVATWYLLLYGNLKAEGDVT